MHSETGIWAGQQATPLSQAEIDIGLLEDRLVDFLGRYGEPAVVGPQFSAVLGEGGGEERLGRLVAACGYEDRNEAFIFQVLDALSHASPQAVARVNLRGIDLPQELLLAFLEEMLPGSGFVNIRELEHYEALCNLDVPADERDSIHRVPHE